MSVFPEDIELSWILVDYLKNEEQKEHQCTDDTSNSFFSRRHVLLMNHRLHSFSLSSGIGTGLVCTLERAPRWGPIWLMFNQQMTPTHIFMTSRPSLPGRAVWASLAELDWKDPSPLGQLRMSFRDIFQTHWTAGTHYHFKNVSVTFPSSCMQTAIPGTLFF